MADDDLLPQEPPSIQDDVRAAFEQHTQAIADKLAEPSAETSVADEAQKEPRPRDEHGKFLPKESTVEAQPKADAPEKVTTDADRPEEKPVQSSMAAGPPSSWSADAKTAWSQIPPSIQAEVVKREREINEGGRQWSEQKRNYEQALSPVQPLAQQYGMPHHEVVARLVSVEQRLADPAQAPQVIGELINAYLTQKGIRFDPAALVNSSQQPQSRAPEPRFDPSVVERIVDERLTQAESQRTISSLIRDFAGEKDGGGKLVHEHFDAVKTLMGNLIASGQATDMQDAYDRAVWSNPDIRSQLLAAQARTVPSVDQEKLRTAKARKAAVSVSGPPNGKANGAADKPVYETVHDAVRAAYEAQMN